MTEKKTRCNKMKILTAGCIVLLVSEARADGITPYSAGQIESVRFRAVESDTARTAEPVKARAAEPVKARTAEPVYANPLETGKVNEVPQQKGLKVKARKSSEVKRDSKTTSRAGGGNNKLSPYIDPYSQTNYNTGRSQSVFTPGF